MSNNPFIAIGSKGTSIPVDFTQLEAPVNIGLNTLRWAGTGHSPAARRAHGWVSKNGHPFEVWPLDEAIRRGFVQVRENVRWEDPNQTIHEGTAYLPAEWTPALGQLQCVAVSSSTWPKGHIEPAPHKQKGRNAGSIAKIINFGTASRGS
jgi:hypothetical protein